VISRAISVDTVARPTLRGVERNDADDMLILAFDQMTDHRLAVALLFVNLAIGPTNLAEVLKDNVDIDVEALGHQRGTIMTGGLISLGGEPLTLLPEHPVLRLEPVQLAHIACRIADGVEVMNEHP
jgi:hypothetical protein